MSPNPDPGERQHRTWGLGHSSPALFGAFLVLSTSVQSVPGNSQATFSYSSGRYLSPVPFTPGVRHS